MVILSRTILLTAGVAACLTLFSSKVPAQDIIQRKPGLWRITMSMGGAYAGMPAMSM